tara:strand:- start:886 stop:1068 length:183 start_codon:yes stop_codon:yes gene_type:complete
MNAAALKDLKDKFHMANRSGKITLKSSWKLLKKRPAEAALFTILAASIIKQRNSRATKQV